MVAGWEGVQGNGCRGEGIKKYKYVVTEQPWDVKYSIGNGVPKELTCMTCGHEQGWGDCLREWGMLVEGSKGGKNRANVIA